MLRRTNSDFHRSGKMRGYVLKDATLTYASGSGGVRTLQRVGVGSPHAANTRKRMGDMNATEPNKRAFPLLTHTDFGMAQDHAANTKWVELAAYMPKRAKGTAPWFRGGDTYSPLYSEQPRYAYHRYIQIARTPYDYKQHFQRFLSSLRAVSRPGAAEFTAPQEALQVLQRMLVDQLNPQHVHYLTAMSAVCSAGEYALGREVWRLMEQQQVWPDDKLIAYYLEHVCGNLGVNGKLLAVEAWNRTCNEKRFLEHGEADPKPVSRTPFTMTRDETLYLPKWKKFFDHDPNLDVADLNRFNTTRNIYRSMCIAMLRTGETGDGGLFHVFFDKLEAALLTTPTPVPEPPSSQMLDTANRYADDPNRDSRRLKQWTPPVTTSMSCRISEPHSRLLSNDQFLVRCTVDFIAAFAELPKDGTGSFRTFRCTSAADRDFGYAAASETNGNSGTKKNQQQQQQRTASEVVAFCDTMLRRLQEKLGADRFTLVDRNGLFATVLAVHRHVGGATGEETRALLKKLHAEGSAVHAACHLEVLRAFADESAALMLPEDLPPYGEPFEQPAASCIVSDTSGKSSKKGGAGAMDPKRLLSKLTEVAAELADSPNFEWTGDHHFAIMRALLNCGATEQVNRYFVSNVLRKFAWTSDFAEVLYLSYRRAPGGVDEWAELTKRLLVWTERYGVRVSERCKRLIERDYDTIKVQVRSFRDVAVFSFRHASELKESQNPAAQLPNPVTDYVSHALPFPDRDTGYPNEYGDIGQWRDPASGIKGPDFYAPAMTDEAQRGYTAEWKENTATAAKNRLSAPFDKKYAEYARGRHPSYDGIYAGPYPEIQPARYDFRRPTRWDFQSVEKQSKFKTSGPWS